MTHELKKIACKHIGHKGKGQYPCYKLVLVRGEHEVPQLSQLALRIGARLNIGIEIPKEFAIVKLSEILTVIRNQKPMILKDKQGGIRN